MIRTLRLEADYLNRTYVASIAGIPHGTLITTDDITRAAWANQIIRQTPGLTHLLLIEHHPTNPPTQRLKLILRQGQEIDFKEIARV